MATTLQFRRYDTATISTLTGANGEIFIDSDKDTIVVQDGTTAGGFPLAREGAYTQANSARDQANSARNQANNAYAEANLKLNLAGGTITGNLIISGNLEVLGNSTTLNVETLSVEDNEITLNSNLTGAPSLNAYISINRGTSPNANLVWNEDVDQWQWNDGDGVYYSFDSALDSYAQANAARDQANTARDTGNGAYAQANGAYGQANGAYGQANGAYGQANGAYDQANGAYGQANGAYGQANAAYGQANSAYDAANNAQVTVYANNASAKTTQKINFVNTASIQVTVSADGSNANVQFDTIGDLSSTTIQAAYGQANTARDTANGAYAQANGAYGQANGAYASANGAYAQANSAANTVRVSANGDSTLSNKQLNFINTASILVTVESAGDGTNANISFSTGAASVGDAYNQANTARGTANDAYSQANTARNTANDSYAAANSNYQPAVTRLNVTNNGASAYRFDQYGAGVDDPTIYVRAGETIAFSLSVTGHPFRIRVSSGGADYDTGLTHVETNGTVSTGSSAQGKESGTLYWKVPYSLGGSTYVYQCGIHSGMVGNIVIEPDSTVIYAQANSARDQANTARGTANDSYAQANSARDQANTARGTANDSYGQANSARDQANTAYGQANTARGTANDSYEQANSARDQANTARNQANNAYAAANLKIDLSGGVFTGNLNVAATLITQNIVPDVNVTYSIGTSDKRFKDLWLSGSTIYLGDTVLSATGDEMRANTFNATVSFINAGLNVLDQANSARDQANTSRNQANSARNQANTAYDTANLKLNLTGGTVTGDLTVSGNLFVSGANTLLNVSNLTVNDSIIFLANGQVGDAFDIGFVGHFDRSGTPTHAGIFRRATDNRFYLFDNYEVEPSNNIIDINGNNFRTGNLKLNTLNADSFVTTAGLNVTDQANTARNQANTARDTANGAYGQANGAYAQANGAYAHANIVYAQANTARDTANASYGQANTARDQANTARDVANASYGQANTARDVANASYGQANTARNTANDAYAQANTARNTANDAYGGANTANTNALNAYGQANTARNTANSAYGEANNRVATVSGTAGRITSSGTTGITLDLATAGAGAASYSSGISAITVDAYGRVTAVTGTANYATTTQAGNSYDQANNARDQANTARDTANSAYGQANTATTNAGNAYGAANTAQTNALNAYGQANTARDQANTARDQANTARTQANTAYAQANSAYNQANNIISGCTAVRILSTNANVIAVTSATGTQTADLSLSDYFRYVLTGTTTITFSNAPSSGNAKNFSVLVLQDSTGSRTLSWGNTIYWAGGTTPPATTAASARDLWQFVTYDGGSTFWGTLAIKDAK